MNSDNTLV